MECHEGIVTRIPDDHNLCAATTAVKLSMVTIAGDLFTTQTLAGRFGEMTDDLWWLPVALDGLEKVRELFKVSK